MQSEKTLFTAAIESARIFNHAVSEVALTSGLLEALNTEQSALDIINLLRFAPEKEGQLKSLLNVLVELDLIKKRNAPGETTYRTVASEIIKRKNLNGELGRMIPNFDSIKDWYPESHADLIRSSNIALLGDDLSFFRSPLAQISFSKEYYEPWRINLTNPLYEFGRLEACKELSRYGTRFLDLACGMGYGAQRLDHLAKGPIEVVCVDKSKDMLDVARQMHFNNASVRFIERDLNHGLPPLPRAYFDGILFNGAFHFIKDKLPHLRELNSVLRMGGMLILGHCYCHSGFEDDAMHDFYFSMIENRSWILDFSELEIYTKLAGFSLAREFHRGSHSYLFAHKVEDLANEKSRAELGL